MWQLKNTFIFWTCILSCVGMQLLPYWVSNIRLLQSRHNIQWWVLVYYCHSHSFSSRIRIKLHFQYLKKQKERSPRASCAAAKCPQPEVEAGGVRLEGKGARNPQRRVLPLKQAGPWKMCSPFRPWLSSSQTMKLPRKRCCEAHLKVAWLRSCVHHSLLSGTIVGETSLLLPHLPAPYPDRQGRELY